MYIGLNVKYPLFWSDFNRTGIFSMGFRKIFKYKSHENSYRGSQVFFMRTNRRTDRHNETNSHFSQFCERAWIFYVLPTQCIYVFCMYLTTNSDCFPILTGLSWRFKSSEKWRRIEQTLILRTLCLLWRRNCIIIQWLKLWTSDNAQHFTYNCDHIPSPHFFDMDAKFGPLEKRIKNDWLQLRRKFSEEQSDTPILTTKGMKKFWKRWK
jgi:hypothetical protein